MALAVGREIIVAGSQSESTGSNIVEGHSDTVSLGTGTGTSDMANLGASDVANLLDLEQPRDIMWEHK